VVMQIWRSLKTARMRMKDKRQNHAHTSACVLHKRLLVEYRTCGDRAVDGRRGDDDAKPVMRVGVCVV
jgi:hypothetical protein